MGRAQAAAASAGRPCPGIRGPRRCRCLVIVSLDSVFLSPLLWNIRTQGKVRGWLRDAVPSSPALCPAFPSYSTSAHSKIYPSAPTPKLPPSSCFPPSPQGLSLLHLHLLPLSCAHVFTLVILTHVFSLLSRYWLPDAAIARQHPACNVLSTHLMSG